MGENRFILPLYNLSNAEILCLNTHVPNLGKGIPVSIGIDVLLSAIFQNINMSFTLFNMASFVSQINAIDFLGYNIHDNSFINKNSKYYIEGAPVHAIAEGKVIGASDEIKDNAKGNRAIGNYVILQHDNFTYSLYAHLKEKSINVKNGDMVKSGTLLGKVGNTGNSSEPHLHFQICYLDPSLAAKHNLFVMAPFLTSKKLEGFKNIEIAGIVDNNTIAHISNIATNYKFILDKLKNLDKINYIQSDSIPEYGFVRNISSIKESQNKMDKYDRPYNSKEVLNHYGKDIHDNLRKDKAHSYRMDSGIELIHKEPSRDELERIWKNWNLMTPEQKKESDKKSLELYGKTNADHYKELINSYHINESYSSGKLYHLSSSNLDGKTLYPRVPHNNWVSNKGYENNSVPRVSFSPTIDGALIGICDGLEDKEMYVHEPEDYSKIEVKRITTAEVPDQEHSKEVWVTTPVKLKCVGKIKVLGRDPKKLKFKMDNKWTHTNGWKWESLNESCMPELKQYLDTKILPIYDKGIGDIGHKSSHVKRVADNAFMIKSKLKNVDDINDDILYAAAIYHDIGLTTGPREDHHTNSAKYVLADRNLKKYMSDDDISLVALACKEHRSSSKDRPSNIYSLIIADADSMDSGYEIRNLIKRAYWWTIHNTELKDEKSIYNGVYSHLKVKYGKGGYSKLFLPESEELVKSKMEKVHKILDDEKLFKKEYNAFLLTKNDSINESAWSDLGDVSTIPDRDIRITKIENGKVFAKGINGVLYEFNSIQDYLSGTWKMQMVFDPIRESSVLNEFLFKRDKYKKERDHYEYLEHLKKNGISIQEFKSKFYPKMINYHKSMSERIRSLLKSSSFEDYQLLIDFKDDYEIFKKEILDFSSLKEKEYTMKQIPIVDINLDSNYGVRLMREATDIGKSVIPESESESFILKLDGDSLYLVCTEWVYDEVRLDREIAHYKSMIRESTILNENLNISELKSLESGDIVKNLDKWDTKPGNNVLYITGISGSGKSTLAREIEEKTNARIIELDNFEHADSCNDTIIKEYMKNNPQLSTYFKAHWQNVDNKIFMDEFYKFSKWLLEKLYADSKHLYILEGIQIYNMFPTSISIGQPVIIKKTPVSIADKRIDSRGEDTAFGRHDINRLKRHAKQVDTYAKEIMKESSTLFADNTEEEKEIIDLFKSDNAGIGLGEFEWVFNNLDYEGDEALEYLVGKCYEFNELNNNISKISIYLKVKLYLKYSEDIATNTDISIYKTVLKLMEKEINFDSVDLTKFDDEGEYNDGIYEAAKVKDKNEIVPVYIVLTSTGSAMSNMIKKFTKEPYNHASISFDSSLEKMFSFGQGDDKKFGFAEESRSGGYLKRFGDVGVQVHTVFVRQWQKEIMEKRIQELIAMKNKLGYSFIGLFGFIINRPIIEDTKMFCSQFVDSMFKLINMDLTDKNSALVTPYDFANTQRKNIFLVYEGTMKEYNPKKTQRKINNALKKYIPLAEYVFATSVAGFVDMLNEYATDYNKLRVLYENALCILEGEILEDAQRLIGPYFDVLYEVKEFPVQFDKEGNLLIKKMGSLDYEHEYYASHKLLVSYETTENLEGMKYELAKLWFMNSILEKKIYDKKTSPEDKTNLTKIRAKILNDFNVYLKFVNKRDNTFNFSDYYNNTPFSDATIKINKSTIDASISIVKSIAKF